MSHRIQKAVWDNAPFGGSRLLVMQALAEVADERGQVVVGFAYLARRSRVSRRAMIRAVQRLRQEEWILRSRKGGQGMVNAYVLNLKKLEAR